MTNMHGAYGRDLDLNLLRVFAVVADEGSITRAAARLYVTQPAVSAAMRRLASCVGTPLLVRQGRGIVLTSRGAELAVAARAHLAPLVAAVRDAPAFDPATTTATVRLGLADPMETLLLPRLLARLRIEAPGVQLVVLPVQFRTIEESLLARRVDLAVTVADALPRSIRRKPLVSRHAHFGRLVCLHDPRHARLSKTPSLREYFAAEHVAVSYAGDLRGVVEDTLGRSRNVRVSVPAFSFVADVVDGSPLVATVPYLLARHLIAARPHLRSAPLPFALDAVTLELLWLRASDQDALARFVRDAVLGVGRQMAASGKRTAPVA